MENALNLYDEKEGGITQEIGSRIERLSADYTARIGEAEDALTASMERLSLQIEETKAQYGAVESLAANEIAEKIEAFTANYRAELASHRQSLEVLIAELTERLDEAKLAYGQEETAAANEIAEKIEAFTTGYRETLAALKEELDGSAENLARQVEHALSLYDEKEGGITQDIGNRIERLSADYTARIEEAEDALSSSMENLSAQIEDVKAQYGQAEAAAAAEIAEKIEAFTAGYRGQLSAFKASLDGSAAELENHIATLRTRFGDEQTGLSDEITQKITALTDAYQKSLALMKTELDGSISDLSGQLDAFKQAFNQKENEAEADMNERLLRLSADYSERLSVTEAALSSSMENLSAQMEKAKAQYGQAEASAAAEIAERLRAFSDEYTGAVSLLKAKLDGSLAELTGRLDETERLYAEKEAGVAAELSDRMDRFTAGYRDNFKQLTTRLDDSLSDLSAQIETVRTIYEEKHGEAASEIAEKMDAFNASYRNTLDALTARLDESMAGLSFRIDAMKAAYETQEGNIESEISAKIAAFNEECRTNLSGLQEKLDTSVQGLHAEMETSLSQMHEKLTAAVESSERTSDSITDSIASGAKLLEQVQAEIDEKMRAMQEKYSGLFVEALNKAERQENEAFEKLAASAQGNIERYGFELDQKISALQEAFSARFGSLSKDTEESLAASENAVAHIRSECSHALEHLEGAESDFTEKVQAISGRIDEFKTDALDKLHRLSELVETSENRIRMAYEKQQAAALASADDQLAAYKKDLEYRLAQIQASGADIDALEYHLRTAMEEITSRVTGDFAAFMAEQQKRYEEFSNGISTGARELEGELHTIEDTIDELKRDAAGAADEKLRSFEEEFEQNLKARGEAINEELAEWKDDFYRRLSELSERSADERRAVEAGYTEKPEKRLSELEQKNADQTERLMGNIRATETSVQEQVEQIKNLVASFSSEIHLKVEHAHADSDAFLKDSAAQSQKALSEEFDRIKTGMLDELKAFEASVQSREDSGAAAIESALREFESWKEKLKAQLDESKELFAGELGGFKELAEQKVRDTHAFIENEYRRLEETSGAQAREAIARIETDIASHAESYAAREEALSAHLVALDKKTDEAVLGYEKRSAEVLDQFQSMYDRMLTETEERVSLQSAEAEDKLSALHEQMQKVSEQSLSDQSAFVTKMRDDATEMQNQMSALQNELNAIREQIASYDHAEQMRSELDTKIAVLEDDFRRLESYKDAAVSLTGQYNDILKIKSEVETLLNEYEVQRTRLDGLGEKYDTLFELSGTLDDRMRGLTATYDEIQNIEVRVRDFQDSLADIAGRYERLEQKNEVIDRVCKDVDASFDNLKTLEERIKFCTRQTETLPDEIRDVQHNVDELLKNAPKIGDAVDKLSDLKKLLDEAEVRMEVINSARQGIGKSEQRLQDLNAQIDSRFKQLELLSNRDAAKNSANVETHVSPQERETVRQLKLQGWSISAIASRLGRSPTEVELLLELPID